jgi:hypothetical protein
MADQLTNHYSPNGHYHVGDFSSVFPSVFARTSQYEKFAQNDVSLEDESKAVIPFGLF